MDAPGKLSLILDRFVQSFIFLRLPAVKRSMIKTCLGLTVNLKYMIG